MMIQGRGKRAVDDPSEKGFLEIILSQLVRRKNIYPKAYSRELALSHPLVAGTAGVGRCNTGFAESPRD
jgi:hypothetical protein